MKEIDEIIKKIEENKFLYYGLCGIFLYFLGTAVGRFLAIILK